VGCLFLCGELGDGHQALLDLIRQPGVVKAPGQWGELRDWHKRMSWWTRVWDKWDGGIPAYHEAYGQALTQAISDTGASLDEIARWRANYDPLVTWKEDA
jgi:hypothetical protein